MSPSRDAPAMCPIGHRPHRAHDGMLVCAHHYDLLGQTLTDIETHAELLDTQPSLAIRLDSSGGGLASQLAPVNLDKVVARDGRRGAAGLGRQDADPLAHDDTPSAIETLHSWARVVREERQLTDTGPVTVASERRTLTFHLDWIARQPWVDEAWSELRHLRTHLMALNHDADERVRSVGSCPTLTSDGECGGRLWPNEDDGSVRCGRCRRIFPREELRHLGDVLIKQGYVELFRAEWYTGVPSSTLRRWVSEKRLTIERNGRRLLVQIVEVEQVRDKLRRTIRAGALDAEGAVSR